ncbi:ankyrin repeat-containing domain protein [Nemania serpens]|nr:ankyrin repeat-containing domain protein [Nemania serpens]
MSIAQELLNAGAHIEYRDAVNLGTLLPEYIRNDESFSIHYLSPLEVAIQRESRQAFEFLIKQGAQLIVKDSHLPDGIWVHCRADHDPIMFKGEDSIVTRYLLTASCTGSTELLAALRNRVGQNAFGKAWRAALGVAIEFSEYSMVAFLLQIEVSPEDLYDSWHLILQEATYLSDADMSALICQMSTKLDFPDHWLPYAAGALPTEIIQQQFPQIFDSDNLMQQKTLEGKSCLEMAMLNRDSSVAQFFFQLLPGEYDSGALCASVLRAARILDYWPVCELLKRRRPAVEKMDAVLENTAISMAGYFNLVDILISLLEYPYPDHPSICAKYIMEGLWADHGQVASRAMNRYVRTWTAWRTLAPSSLRSPLLLTTIANRRHHYKESSISLMIEKGYRCDTPHAWVEIALQFSGLMLNFLIMNCEDVNAWISYDDAWNGGTVSREIIMRGPTSLHIAILCKRLDMARLLIERGADVNQRKAKDSLEEMLFEYDSCLQIAVKDLDDPEQEEAIGLLLDAGADLNAPASWNAGATALQFAAMKGKLSLARRLIGLGANINAPRGLCWGRTCLEGAAEQGKLDMVQYLLNVGVDTEGTRRLQYIHATVLAEEEEHYAIVDLLRTHRNWDSTDEVMYKELSFARNQGGIIIVHPEEHLAEEFASLRSRCRDHRKEIIRWQYHDLVWPDLDGDSSAQEALYPEEEQSVNWEDWIEDAMLD